MPVFAFILLQVPELEEYLGSYMRIMDEFIPETMSMGEEGYALTLLHTVVEHLHSMMIDD